MGGAATALTPGGAVFLTSFAESGRELLATTIFEGSTQFASGLSLREASEEAMEALEASSLDYYTALRNALYEIDRLREKGLTEAEFELTRDFLLNYSKLWVQTQAVRLGFHMDSRFYGMPYYIDEIEKRLAAMSVEDVNRAARKYLSTDNYVAVLVTGPPATWFALSQKGPQGRWLIASWAVFIGVVALFFAHRVGVMIDVLIRHGAG